MLNDHVRAFLEAKHGKLTKANGWRSVDSPNLVLTANLDTGADSGPLPAIRPELMASRRRWCWWMSPRSIPGRFATGWWAALATSLGKMPGSRAIVLGTKPVAGAGHYFTEMLEGGADYLQVHDAPADADPQDEAAWLAANPSLPLLPGAQGDDRAGGEASGGEWRTTPGVPGATVERRRPRRGLLRTGERRRVPTVHRRWT